MELTDKGQQVAEEFCINTLNALRDVAYGNAENKGFNVENKFERKNVYNEDGSVTVYVLVPEAYFNILHMGLRLALMHSELSEALEAIRSKDPAKNNLGEELADCMIRIFHHCGDKGIDIGKEVIEKMKKNASRPHMHGKTC